MKQFKIFFTLVFVSLLFTNCDPNDSNGSNQNDTTFAQNFGASASRDFIGQVVDADNHPLQNVTVKIGTSTVQTDINGVFIINGASVYEKFAHITATKTGYIDGSRSMVPTTGKNNVKIMMVSNTPIETIQSGTASEVSIYSGTKVNFDGAFQDENGNAYTGSVQVSMFHLTPSDENIDKLMPGMLYAQTQTNEAAVLETYGMLNVELRGSAGQKLNIASGHTAEITLRIDDSQLSTAPSSIPLWHFDEEKGYWKEDGVATKVGNKYVGEVSHFSWWNCDAPFPTVTLTITLVVGNGNTLSNVGVGLIVNGTNYPAMGFTNNNGQVSGQIPTNQGLTLNVYGACGVIYTTSIGPFSTNTTLPNIVINSSATVLISNVVGTLVKCDNTNVTNGYVMLSRNGHFSMSTVTDSAFSFNEIYCNGDTPFTLKGFDYDNLQTTDAVTYNFTPGETKIGNLIACNTITEFVSYKLDNNPIVYYLQNVGGFTQTNPNYFGIYAANQTEHINITGQTSISVPGTYTTNQFSIYGQGNGIDVFDSSPNTMQFRLNSYGTAVGEYIDLTFSGTFTTNTVHTLTGVAHVIRDN